MRVAAMLRPLCVAPEPCPAGEAEEQGYEDEYQLEDLVVRPPPAWPLFTPFAVCCHLLHVPSGTLLPQLLLATLHPGSLLSVCPVPHPQPLRHVTCRWGLLITLRRRRCPTSGRPGRRCPRRPRWRTTTAWARCAAAAQSLLQPSGR